MTALIKGALKSSPRKQMKPWDQSLMNDNIINKPPDLAILLWVLKSGINPEEWSKHEFDSRKLVNKKVRTIFDGSGESATENCFELAVEYGFIRKQTDANGLKRFVESPKSEVDLSHDWFCFDCDVIVGKTNRQFLKCDQCLRVFHRKCTLEFEAVKDFKCRYCKQVEGVATNGFINKYQNVNQKRMSRVIGFLLDFVETRMKIKFDEIDLNFEKNHYIYVFKEMSLSLIRQKVKREEYKSLPEFDDDFFVFIHNLHITQIDFQSSGNHQKFLDLRTFMSKEFDELKKCVDCYERANDKALHESDKEWFCIPCQPVHKPVFVKLKNYPYWPAKVINTSDDKKRAEVCFFENLREKSKKSCTFKKSEVKSSEIKEINDLQILDQIKGNQRLIKPMELLVKYLELMPNKSSVETIEMIKRNNLSSNKPTNSQSYDEAIESAIKKGLNTPSNTLSNTPSNPSSKSQRNKKTNPMPKMAVQPTPQQKGRKKKTLSSDSSNASTRSSSPLPIPVLTNQLNDSVDSLSDRVPNMNISDQPPPLDLCIGLSSTDVNIETESPQNTTKRRSGRIAALITPQKSDTKKKSEVKSTKVFKLKDPNKSIDESQPMEVDVEDSHQTTPTNESHVESTACGTSGVRIDSADNCVPQSYQSVIIVNNSEQNIAIITQSSTDIDSNTSIDSNSNQSSKLRDSIIESDSTKDLTIDLTPKTEVVITTSMTSTSRSDTTLSMTSQSSITMSSTSINTTTVPLVTETTSVSTPLMAPIVTSTSGAAATPVGGAVNQNENLTPNINYNETQTNGGAFAVMRLNQIVMDLKEMKGSVVPKIDLDEKLILVQHYYTQLSKEVEAKNLEIKDLKNELRDVKSKRWCVVCQRLAKHYCCVRYYCSHECQKTDWRNGHHSQCLDIKK